MNASHLDTTVALRAEHLLHRLRKSGGAVERDMLWQRALLEAPDLEVAVWLLERGANPHAISPDILMAPRSKWRTMAHSTLLISLISAGRDINKIWDSHTPTDLLAAVYFECRSAAKILITHGARGDITAKSALPQIGDATPFEMAFTQGDWDMCHVLLGAGVHWGAKGAAKAISKALERARTNTQKANPYVCSGVWAAVLGHPDAQEGGVQSVIRSYLAEPPQQTSGGAIIREVLRSRKTIETPSMGRQQRQQARANSRTERKDQAQSGDEAVAEFARRLNIDLDPHSNRPDPNKMGSVLMEAIRWNGVQVAKTILDWGVAPELLNAIDTQYGETALHAAARGGKSSLITHLLVQGADPEMADRAGDPPLYKLFDFIRLGRNNGLTQNDIQAVNALVGRMDLNILRDKEGTALHALVNRIPRGDQQITLVNILLQHGADPRAVDKNKQTPKDIIAKRLSDEDPIVSHLARAEAQWNAQEIELSIAQKPAPAESGEACRRKRM